MKILCGGSRERAWEDSDDHAREISGQVNIRADKSATQAHARADEIGGQGHPYARQVDWRVGSYLCNTGYIERR